MKTTKITKRLPAFFIMLLLVFDFLPVFSVSAEKSKNELINEVADGIINWKKSDNGVIDSEFLINDRYLENAGTTQGDWYPIGLSRLSKNDNYLSYLAVISDVVSERYKEPCRLSSSKATEWHRIALAVSASGGDPTNIGKDENGNPINLIKDGVYDRGKVTSLGRQGINGFIWGLIALDSMMYEVPKDAFYQRDDIIIEILKCQLDDGGFALSGKKSDTDITAMALQALSPYRNSEKIYTYTKKQTGKKVRNTVNDVINEALLWLSETQLGNGGYSSWGTENAESIDQVIVALCSLCVDPFEDERFIKNGNTLIDALMRFRMEDGGFVHSFEYDEDNPTSRPDRSNTMAGEQTLYTMAALWRFEEGKRNLYDFRQEFSEGTKEKIDNINRSLEKDAASSLTAENAEKLLADIYSLPFSERRYIKNYWLLSDFAKKNGINVQKIADETPVSEDSTETENDSVILYFSESDRQKYSSLPEEMTTEYYVTVTYLLDKIEKCEDFESRNEYIKDLSYKKEAIKEIQEEIDSLNALIKEKLYPFDKITLKDSDTVNNVVKRYENLSEYDRRKIERYEDVIKTKTKLDNIKRGIIIGIVLFFVALTVFIFLVRRIRKKKRKKITEMEELASLYKDEE